MKDDWFWASCRKEPAGDRFVITNGQDELWPRVRSEVAADEQCAWDAVHRGEGSASIEDILGLMFTVVPTYRVNHNRFVLEAAKIPAFARFLRDAPFDLGNYVSNSIFPDALIPLEPYSSEATRKLGHIVSRTLNIEPDWFEA